MDWQKQESANLPLEKPLAIADKIAADEKLPSLPSIPLTEDDKSSKGDGGTSQAKNDAKSEEDEFALLAKRFEALKKK